MRSDSYIGLFRAPSRGDWRVSFPDLPGCEARGTSFKDVLEAARYALAEHLGELDGPPPRPRSTAELLIDSQRDQMLSRALVDGVMHPVPVAVTNEGLAPIDLVALQARGSGASNPQLGA